MPKEVGVGAGEVQGMGLRLVVLGIALQPPSEAFKKGLSCVFKKSVWLLCGEVSVKR